jgi:hypothetical protein
MSQPNPDVSIQLDDALLDILGSATPDTASALADNALDALLLTWRDAIETRLMPALVDVDTAQAAIQAGA